jgi:hypothetical protein
VTDEPEPTQPKRIKAGQDLLRTLEDLGAATETSLDLPVTITYKQYEALGVALSRAHRAVCWMIADWINQGEALFDERVHQAVEATGLNRYTLDNYARIARDVPRERRVVGVPFGVHAEVASLEPDQQTLWLEKAKANDWRRDELRAELRPVKKLPEIHAGVDNGNLEEAARDLVRTAKKYGNDFLVGRPSFVQLCHTLGEEV